MSLNDTFRATSLLALSLVLTLSDIVGAQVPRARCDLAQKEVTALHAQLGRQVQTIRRLGFATTAEAIEEWTGLNQVAKEEFDRRYADAMQGVVFSVAARAIKSGKPLNHWNANTVVKRLRSDGFMTRGIEKALRQLARERGKPIARSRMLGDLKALEISVAAAQWSRKPVALERKVEALQTVSDILPGSVRSPIETAREYVVALTFAGGTTSVQKPAIERLFTLTDRELDAMTRVTDLVRDTARKLSVSKSSIATCEKLETAGTNGGNKATPPRVQPVKVRSDDANGHDADQQQGSVGSEASQVTAVAQLLAASGYSFTKLNETTWRVVTKSKMQADISVVVVESARLVVFMVPLANRTQITSDPSLMTKLLKTNYHLNRAKLGLTDNGDLFLSSAVSARVLDLKEFKSEVDEVALATEVAARVMAVVTPGPNDEP